MNTTTRPMKKTTIRNTRSAMMTARDACARAATRRTGTISGPAHISRKPRPMIRPLGPCQRSFVRPRLVMRSLSHRERRPANQAPSSGPRDNGDRARELVDVGHRAVQPVQAPGEREQPQVGLVLLGAPRVVQVAVDLRSVLAAAPVLQAPQAGPHAVGGELLLHGL